VTPTKRAPQRENYKIKEEECEWKEEEEKGKRTEYHFKESFFFKESKSKMRKIRSC